MRINDTIAAVSTPRGKGGIAVIRISGDEALSVADKVFRPANGTCIFDTLSSKAVYGKIYSPSLSEREKKPETPIDDGLATVFRAPASFSGEDTVEISCHGGILVTEAVLSAVLSAGARLADAGEFTRRAFVNGKLGLSEAEALSNLLEAKSYAQMTLARSGLEGRLEKKCEEIYSSLRFILASLYAKIDYPDEELADLSTDEMHGLAQKLLDEVLALDKTYIGGHAVAEGITTVICGRPNVGKSSLYNGILGKDAAIVTEISGTTRDVLEETATLGGVTLRLCDTAGLRETSDVVEKIGIEKAYERIGEAELVLAVFDASKELEKEDMELISMLKGHSDKVVAVLNKSDIAIGANMDIVADTFAHCVRVSAKKEGGIGPLAEAIREKYIDGSIDFDVDPVVFGARQHAALVAAAEHIRSSLDILDFGVAADAASFELEAAMSALSLLEGREVSSDIVSEIFSKFCVGK